MSEERITLKNVRLSFPSIFRRSVYNGEEGKYEATFLIPKSDAKTKKLLDKAIEAKMKEAKIKVKSGNKCLKDGDEADYDGYEDHWSIKASNKKRPVALDRDKSPLTEDDEVLYAGCYVDAIISLWAQDNTYGKRINANLIGVRFRKDGEPFGAGHLDAEEVADQFDDLDDDDEDEGDF